MTSANGSSTVVIIGGGFGGLATAKGLKNTDADVFLFDRTNHHVFQPLLYQVATATLAPADIAAPIRQILSKQRNTTVLMEEVIGVEPARKRLLLTDRSVPFDYLVIATGARHSYFGHNEFARYAPGLKALSDATSIRARILEAFEIAEREEDRRRHSALLTFVLVGAGPTGVEMAGAIAELRRFTLEREFRRIDPRSARIILVEAAPRILGSFHETLANKAYNRLQRLGVQVITGAPVEHVDEHGVIVRGQRIESRNVIWTAGVQPSLAGKWLGVETDRSGRARVSNDCSVPGYPHIFVVGDTATLDQDGRPLPGVAQVALQQGRYVAKVISARIAGKSPPPPFRYSDHGNLAVIGRGFAILEYKHFRLSGYFAWLIWAFVHIAYLAEFGNRLRVMTQWAWTYFTRASGSRLIVEPLESLSEEKSKSSAIPDTERPAQPAHHPS